MDTVSICASSETIKSEHLRSQQLEDTTVKNNNTLEEVFPWLSEFNKIIHSAINNKNYENLKQLMVSYTQNILSSVTANKVEFDDKVNLMSHVSNMLILCHLYWLDVKQDVADHNSYLRKMSALLNVYIDMELKIFMEKRLPIRNSPQVAAKILAALYIYLNNSEEHIFRVLLRIKPTTEKYTKICNYIFMKSFDNIRKSITDDTDKTSITDVAYVRCLLVLKMWKKMDKISDRKEKINNMAISLLGLRMPKLRNELLKFVPRPPTDQENETLWLLKSNLLDLKQAHKYFLLFQDKMDHFADSRSNEIIQTDQSCSKPQKHQTSSLFRRSTSSGSKANHEANKNPADNLQNRIVIPNTKGNKFSDQSYLQKKGTRKFKPLKKSRPNPGRTIIIDLTGDDKITIPCKIKRKKIKRNLECLKSKQKFQKHINPLKYSSRVANGQRTGESFNKDDKSLVEKVHLECKVASDKVHSNTDGGTSINSKPPLHHVYHINSQKNEHSNMKNQMNNTCPEFGKGNEKQYDYNSHYSKSSMLVDQDVKEFKFLMNVSKENKPETRVSSHVTYMMDNTPNSYNNPIIPNKQTFIFQEDNAMETIPLFKTCQDSIAEQPSFKQELPTSMNGNATQKSHKCCETSMPVDMHDVKHLLIKELKSINDHNSQITEIIKQKECHQVNECPNCCAKIDSKPIVFINNDITTAKTQDTSHNTLDNDNDVKLAYDTNIIYMLSDRNKCVYVVNHIGERVMTMHAEKKVQCLDKQPNDTCTVPTVFAGDQIVESPLCNQHVNFNNMTLNDYGSAAKYSETTVKEQQSLLCPHIVQCGGEIPSNILKFYKIKSYAGANAKADNGSLADLKSFPKVEEADEITKADYVNDLENICFLNNIQTDS